MKTSQSIPYLDLKGIQSRFKNADQSFLEKFIDSGQYIGGDLVTQFENSFAKFCGVEYCIGTGNGLDALTIILRSEIVLGNLKSSAKVLVPANTYLATWLSIYHAGLTIVPIDIMGLNLSYEDLKDCKQEYDAILCVDFYGKMVDDNVYAFAKAKQIPIYTDAAQSHGARNNSGSRSGSLARASAFSFYPSKNLGAMGDAGAITTDDPQLAHTCRQIGNYGKESRFINSFKGVNSRLDPLQAGFLMERLASLEKDNQQRLDIAQYYYNNISNDQVELLEVEFLNNSVIHVFPIFTDHKARLQSHLGKNGIGFNSHYEVPPHKQIAFEEFNSYSFKNAEKFHEREVSIPCNPLISKNQSKRIVEVLNQFS